MGKKKDSTPKSQPQSTEVVETTTPKTNKPTEETPKFNLVKFLAESREELGKVVWPSRQQLIGESVTVILMVTLVATTIYLVDNVFVWLSTKVFS